MCFQISDFAVLAAMSVAWSLFGACAMYAYIYRAHRDPTLRSMASTAANEDRG